MEQLFQIAPLREDIYISTNIHIYSELYDRSKPAWIYFASSGNPQQGAGRLTFRSGINVISVTCRGGDWYQYPDVPAAKAALAAAASGFPAVHLMGGSMGGFGALHWSGQLAPKVILAYSPQASIGPNRPDGEDRWEEARLRIEATYGFPHDDLRRNLCRKARLIIVHDPHDMDARHVAMIEELRPVERLRIPFAGHGTLEAAARVGMTSFLMREVIEDRIDVARWQETLRARLSAGPRVIGILRRSEQRNRPVHPGFFQALNRLPLPTKWGSIALLMRAAMRANRGGQAADLALRILNRDAFIRSDAFLRDLARLAPFLAAEGRSRAFARLLLDLAEAIRPPRAEDEEQASIEEIARELGQDKDTALRLGFVLIHARFRRRRSNLLMAAAQILAAAGHREEALGPALAANATLTTWDKSNPAMARLLMSLDRPGEAAAAARRAIAFDPSDFAAHGILGQIHEQAGDWTAAVELWRNAIAAGADRTRSTYRLARALTQARRPAEALEVLDEAAAGGAGSMGLDRLRAVCQQRLGDFQSAMETYRRLVAAEPADGSLHHGLGECLVQLGLLDEALAAARAAVALSPHQPRFARQLASIERRKAQQDQPPAAARAR